MRDGGKLLTTEEERVKASQNTSHKEDGFRCSQREQATCSASHKLPGGVVENE